MRAWKGPHGPGVDGGFTLVELLFAIVIMGVITVPLGNVVIGYLRNSDTTTARLLESHDVQIASAYWAQDVASIGARSTASPYVLLQSVSLGDNGWTEPNRFQCGSVGTPVARLAWDDSTVDPVTKEITTTPVQVAYVRQATELHRLRCNGSAVVSSDVTLAHELDPLTPPTVECSTDCTAAPDVPRTVKLKLTLKDPKNRDGEYAVVLTGQRRQS